jgi:hypothetical protein
MNDLIVNTFIALLGGALGFGLKWLLAERKERYELRRSIAPMRAEAYRSLWSLCRSRDIAPEARNDRAKSLWEWYDSGGGLFLSLAASNRFFRAIRLLEKADLSAAEYQQMKDHLTWLRTEMKYHIGSYTRGEAETQIK